VIKTILCCLIVGTLSAQPVFQKKIDGLELAEGLALMPDGGYVMAGLQGNCIQIIRLDANGTALWMRQICLANQSDDISFSLLHLVADKVVSGAFYLGFRKGAFSSSPDNLLNLMKFDANGSLLWETQLRMVFYLRREKQMGHLWCSKSIQTRMKPSGPKPTKPVLDTI